MVDNYYYYNHLLFKNTNFYNNFNGLRLHTSAVIELINVNMYNNMGYGIYIKMDGDIDYYTLFRSAVNVCISSTAFVNNAYAIHVEVNLEHLSINIDNYTFNNTLNDISQRGIEIESFATLTFASVSNSIFYNNQNRAVKIETVSDYFWCSMARIVFKNVIVQSTTKNASNSVYIHNEDVASVVVILEKVNFTSNLITHYTAILLIESYFTSMACQLTAKYPVSIQLTECTFDNNTAQDHVVMLAFYIVTYGYQDSFEFFNAKIELSDCDFDQNFGGKSIVYVNVPTTGVSNTPNISLILHNLITFSNNKGTGLRLVIPIFWFKGNALFVNNSATNGAAVYLEEVYTVSSDDNANVQFINNLAEQKGGAMYINLATDFCDVFKNISKPSNISFIDNSASITGDCIYFSIHQNCHINNFMLYYPDMFNYSESQTVYPINPPVVTSPYNVTLHPPAIAMHNDSNGYLIQESKMLGEPIKIIASVFDYFDNITEPVTFSINCETCDDYRLSRHQISVHNQSLYELKIFSKVSKESINNTSVNISIALPSNNKPINALLIVQLTDCRVGYLYDNTQKQCYCYPHPDVVHCKEDYVEIKIGYWVGVLTELHYTSSILS